jgi:acyl-CoA synthetase (AMP-forming)/AMP-acid ligase II
MEALEVTDFEFSSSVALDAGLGGDLAMLMFTSGTTGLPKAARITNRRWAFAALGTAAGCRLTSNDTVFCALPLHHSTGMLVAVGGALVGGARLALAPRFSTSTFWDDVHRYGATVVVYVGEMCRYLVNADEVPGERDNSVRVFAGNGMRADVWRRLNARFHPERIVEFYGSTEGNVVLANLTGEPIGSVGRPLPGTTELTIVRYDFASGDPLRNLQGRCERCETGEAGLVLGRIVEDDSMGDFDGYVDSRDTERKTIRDVFSDGDAWFNTGDLLSCDEEGDWWFADRVGDTYRYKGENVSTELVRGVIASLGLTEWSTVYGVEVDGEEGRSGMAAIRLRSNAIFDGETFYRHLAANLTPAGVPRWIRVTSEIELTPSFKVRRAPLAQLGAEGPDVYELDAKNKTYIKR